MARSSTFFDHFDSVLKLRVSLLTDLLVLLEGFPYLLLVRVLIFGWKLVEEVHWPPLDKS